MSKVLFFFFITKRNQTLIYEHGVEESFLEIELLIISNTKKNARMGQGNAEAQLR